MGNTIAIMKNVNDFPTDAKSVITSKDNPPQECISDPRSPSDQFTRTPIEVKHGIVKSTKMRSRVSHPIESLGAVERGSYVMFATSTTNEGQRLRFISDDPRSPTQGIIRTPIQVFSPEGIHTESQSSASITSGSAGGYETGEDLLFSLKDSPSASLGNDLIVSPTDVFHTPMKVEEEPKASVDDVFIDEDLPLTSAPTCPLTKEQKQKNNENEICVKLFHTPPAKASALKVRTPLRAFSANESLPQQILRAKQARGIMQSMDVENTPPKQFVTAGTRSIQFYLK